MSKRLYPGPEEFKIEAVKQITERGHKPGGRVHQAWRQPAQPVPMDLALYIALARCAHSAER